MEETLFIGAAERGEVEMVKEILRKNRTFDDGWKDVGFRALFIPG